MGTGLSSHLGYLNAQGSSPGSASSLLRRRPLGGSGAGSGTGAPATSVRDLECISTSLEQHESTDDEVFFPCICLSFK